MSTPRTIKASEVVKGMRVRVEESLGSRTTQVTEGPVMADANPYHAEYVELELDGATIGIAPDHPVTVLAEPDPEWVEGAWYWTLLNDDARRTLRRRVSGGWSVKGDESQSRNWGDEAITVLGRVLIVYWPGDDVAREFAAVANWWEVMSDSIKALTAKVADAIRAQGGVR